MAVLLPILSWALLYLNLSGRGMRWRPAFLASSVCWGCSVVASAEILSLFRAFNFAGLIVFWSGAAIAASFFLRGKFAAPRLHLTWSASERTLTIAVLSIVALTGVLSIVAAPNNWDSMLYHMSRVMHWIQNASVAHFPTANVNQIQLPPWAEFAIAQTMILSGGDYFANGVQWFSMVGCIVGVTLLASELGATVKSQVFAAFAAATIPMLIVQSTSTQNDLVVGFWLISFVYFGLRASQNWKWCLLAGASLGLAILTKATAYIIGLPFCVLVLGVWVKRRGWASVLRLAPIPLLVLLINAGHYSRNVRLFGNPLVSNAAHFANGRLDWKTMISNSSRDAAIELGSPFPAWNDLLDTGIRRIHEILNRDSGDQATTIGTDEFYISTLYTHEDYAGNPLHFAAIMGAVLCVFLLPRFRRRRFFQAYASAGIAAFFLIGAALRWDPWQCRYLLPVLLLSIPLIAVIVFELNMPLTRYWFASLIAVAAIPCLLFNTRRTLVTPPAVVQDYLQLPDQLHSVLSTPRQVQYFNSGPWLQQSYLDAVELIRTQHARNVGLMIDADTWEYPIWALTRDKGMEGPRIEYMSVDNPSSALRAGDFSPDVLVTDSEDGIQVWRAGEAGVH